MRPLVIGNWKMNLTSAGAVAHARDLLSRIGERDDREVAVAPPFTMLPGVAETLRDGPIRLAAQDLFWEDRGPYTGEVSPLMLQEIGVTYVLVGHSERRQHLGETDRVVQRKVRAALRADLRPVVCVGEREAARSSGRAFSVVRSQVLRALEEIPAGRTDRLAVAYEPVWAIGTGRAATPADAAEMHACIRAALGRLFGEAGEAVRVLYGGSVTAANIDGLMARPGIDGVLVGGASLKADEFARIAEYRRPA
ncbi:MAG: triose-phosphate isomerase [Acidobacteriota bacterium]